MRLVLQKINSLTPAAAIEHLYPTNEFCIIAITSELESLQSLQKLVWFIKVRSALLQGTKEK